MDENRKRSYPADFLVQPEEIYIPVRISKIQELLNKGQSKKVFFEARKNVYSLTIGNYTLEEILDYTSFVINQWLPYCHFYFLNKDYFTPFRQSQNEYFLI